MHPYTEQKIIRATHVPVGQDQLQHLELARDIANTFNKTFKHKVFPRPTAILRTYYHLKGYLLQGIQ